MTAPFYKLGHFSGEFSLIVAFVIGVAFGFFLERGGLGNARKLAGQFYLTDLTVFKVMFSAVVTAMLGLFWLSWLGWLDLSLVFVSPTYLIPQLVGGLIFGVGFVVAGLCPGTSCVAVVTGKIDGLFAVLGFFAGVLVFAEFYGGISGWLYSSSLGQVTLPQLLGVPPGLLVLAVVLLALAGFYGAGVLERGRASQGAGE